ncbi:LacI family DNA-binding transcriptional regulator [Allorhizobium sp. BGMRC 0089]|uniref:LacI family DNA-binding transcriptional regulator n=1 Tax=Allorhizobium sonneratiae TaxID=2934936 RepID=UPI0020348AA4|nr:LacI family DNA-binding transcriptional regulator [Allorhizobium sonneratiae]MCM2293996.1 LacI family DNA-binding transcriptional regulator [Allorhizobium sonneratiae]
MATLKTIAKAAGVSSTTVWRVLNSDATLSITEEKRRIIIETAAAMNYAPPRTRNRAAGLSALRRVAIVHFLRPEHELADPYYVSLRLGIERRSHELKMETVRIYGTDARPEPAFLENASGVIAIGSFQEEQMEWLARYSRHLVFADSIPPDEAFDAAASDLSVAMRKLLGALQDKGYRRIAYLGWIGKFDSDPFGEIRCRTYVNWMRDQGSFDPALCLTEACPDHHGENLGDRLAHRLLQAPALPEAIVTCNDNVAMGVYRVLQERGLNVPKDIAIASFNDIPMARLLNPPLTTVRLPAEQIGETAVDLLAERLAGRRLVKQITLASTLQWRGSIREHL